MKYLYSFLILTGMWICLYFIVNSAIVPSPLVVFIRFFQIFYAKLLRHTLYSLFRVVTALVISLIVGVAIGILCGVSQKFDKMVSPLIYFLSPIPKAAFLPVLMVFFGLGELSKILLIILVIVFQCMIATRDGIKNIPYELRMYEKSLRLNKRERLVHFTIPAILPSIFTVLRMNAGIATAVLFFSENFATKYGLGYFIMNNWVMGNYIEMYCGILAISVMGMGLYGIIQLLEMKFVKGNH